MANLHVALYRPQEGNVHHWAFWLEGPTISHIFEATGEPGAYALQEQPNTHPTDCHENRHKRNIFVAQIDDIAGFMECARGCVPPKDSAAWNCQEYVLEVLEAANGDGVLGDWEYGEIKGVLEGIHYE